MSELRRISFKTTIFINKICIICQTKNSEDNIYCINCSCSEFKPLNKSEIETYYREIELIEGEEVEFIAGEKLKKQDNVVLGYNRKVFKMRDIIYRATPSDDEFRLGIAQNNADKGEFITIKLTLDIV